MTEHETSVIIETVPIAQSHLKIGRIILNRPKALNALSFEMLESIDHTLAAWAKDTSIACVWLEGSGEKAFCAGGDVASLYRELQGNEPSEALAACQKYFETEYTCDYRIHSYPKPIVVWGDGIVMGGGIGLLVGASHRIVTETSLLAMPEITIGLYPDVGASYFLSRMPGRMGLFLGLTASRFGAGDALYLDLADAYVERHKKDELWSALLAADYSGPWHQTVDLCVENLQSPAPDSPLKERQTEIDSWMRGHNIHELAENFLHFKAAADDQLLASAQKSFSHGSPSSLAIVYEQIRRSPRLTLIQVFQQELCLSLQCCRQADFKEGVRALLIDKDRKPAWKPALLHEVNSVESYFQAPWAINPLHHLNEI